MKKTHALFGTLLITLMTSFGYAATRPAKLTVLLDFAPSATHAPLIIAKQQGYFKEQGLNVELIHPNHASDPSTLIALNQADIGLIYEPWLIENIDHGADIIRIGSLIDKPLNCVVALKQSGIKTLVDLKHKRIGTSSNNLTNAILIAMLKKQGLTTKDFQLVTIHGSLTQALLTNKVDAISGTQRNLEVPLLESRGHHLVVFFPEEHGIPNYSELAFIANTAHRHDPRFPKFLIALKKAVRYLDEHPTEAWQQFAKAYPNLDNKLNREYWFATLPYFAENPANLDSDEWQHFAEFMHQNRLIGKTQSVSHYAIAIG